jgi:fatty-acyl-CoA synthase
MALTERARGRTVFEILAERSGRDPDRPFLLFENRHLTYAEVEASARALAAALSGLGVEAGDRVALILPGCPEFPISLFALARMGAVAVPLDPRLTESELRYMLRHSQSVAAVTVENLHGVDFLQLFEDLLPTLPELQYLVTVGEEDLWYDDRIFQFDDLVSSGIGRTSPEAELDPSTALMTIVYTSGTTGKPKGVELTHGNLVHPAAATVQAVGLTPDDRVFGLTSLFHVFGLGPGILGSALAGSSIILQEEFEPSAALDLIERHGATIHYGVPTVFAQELRQQEARPREVGTLRRGLVAGAPIPEELLRRVEARLCPRLLTGYSLSETASILAVTLPDDSDEKRRFTVGRPVEGMEVRVLERDGSELPEESLGEIAVRGPGVMRGYYRQPVETRASFDEDGFFLTGDLGIVDEEGFIHLVGRRKEVIIRSGYNVYPREVEDRLHAHPAVGDVAVAGVRDELLGEAICAAVVPLEGAIVTDDELRDWCRETLAAHKVPDRIRFLDALPMTGTGKIRRVELVRLLEEAPERPET